MKEQPHSAPSTPPPHVHRLFCAACALTAAFLSGLAPGATVLLVTTSTTPNTQESLRITDFQSWGYTVTTIGSTSSQADFDTAVAAADVVYIPEDVSATDVDFKLREAPIGVVNEEVALAEEFGFASASFQPSDTSSLDIVDNSHYITSPFATGTLTFTTSAGDIGALTNTEAPGLQVLGNWGSSHGLAVLETGATLVNTHNSSDTAFGRRVLIGLSNDYDWNELAPDGTTIVQRAIEWASEGGVTEIAGHWKLDETSGTTVEDSVSGADGTLVGGTRIADGVIGRAIDLTADASDRIELPHEVLNGADNATITAWVRPEPSSSRRTYFSGANASNSNEILLGVSDTTVAFYDGEDDNNTSRLIWNLPYSIANRWSHLAIIRDSSANQALLYLDGQLVGAQSATLNPLDIDSGGLVVGEDQDSVGGGFQATDSYAGSIDDIRVYRRALDAAGVGEAYGLIGHWKLDETAGTTATDSSLLGNDGLYRNSVTLGNDGPYPGSGGAADFDGTTDQFVQVDLADDSVFDLTEAISVACWVKVDAHTNLADCMMAKGTNTWRLSMQAAESVPRFVCDGLTPEREVVANQNLEDGAWHHVVGVYDGSELRIYIDGQLDNSVSTSGMMDTNDFRVQLAEVGNGASLFNGLMHDARIYNRAISHAEIAELYGLVGHWNFEEASGVAVVDSSLAGNDASFATGTPTRVTGVRGNALEFDGNNDAATDVAFDPPERGSVAFWFRRNTGLSFRERLFGLGVNWEVRQEPSGEVAFDLGASPVVGSQVFITTDDASGVDGWTHIVAQFDAADDSYEVYVDGQLNASGINTVDMVKQTAAVLSFGTRTGSTERFDGALDDVRVYNRWLQPKEIATLHGLIGHWKFDEGSGVTIADSTLIGNDATFNTGAPQWISGQMNGALEFNGTNDAVTNSSFQPPSTGAVAFWFRSDGALAGLQRPFGVSDAFEAYQDADGVMVFDLNHAGSSRAFSTHNPVSVPGRWYHIVANFNADTDEIETYVNGLLIQSEVHPQDLTQQPRGTLSFGTSTGSTQRFSGALDDLRIYNRTLSPDEVATLTSGVLAGPRILRWIEVR